MADSKCLFCEVRFSKPALLVPFQHTLEKLTGTSKDKTKGKAEIKDEEDEAKNEFFKIINSFLNAKEGSVLIHSDGDRNIDLFDQKVDGRLVTLIPDNALYQDVYERSFLDDNHLYYRVKPRSGQRPLSILDFNTKFAVSKGLVDPTQGQMRDFMKHVIEEEEKSPSFFEAYRGTAVLEKDQPAMLNSVESGSKPFRENICTQAKAYDQTDLKEFCWKKSKPYISAFSKIPGGGSVYIGIAEDKTGNIATGKLIVKGVNANEFDEQEMQEELLRRVGMEMMHIGRREPDNVIETEALPVLSDKSSVVIQIKVNYYHGIYFTSLDGPKLFTAKWKHSGLEVANIDVNIWLKHLNSWWELHVH
ncbi:uncharacterized protein [Littorina saxatilis]|uniref:uncharacterized protein n=1 Tax=Littorina saxatilis TaxID=31220 RepID=UPI0038B45752